MLNFKITVDNKQFLFYNINYCYKFSIRQNFLGDYSHEKNLSTKESTQE